MIEDLNFFLERPRPEVGVTGSHTWAADLAERLMKFHDRLFRHFRYEESSGMFEELVREYPHTAHVVDALGKDHDRILGSLRALLTSCMTYAEGKQPENPQLRRWTASVMEQLSEHEQQETEMMQRAYTEDIGAGD